MLTVGSSVGSNQYLRALFELSDLNALKTSNLLFYIFQTVRSFKHAVLHQTVNFLGR